MMLVVYTTILFSNPVFKQNHYIDILKRNLEIIGLGEKVVRNERLFFGWISFHSIWAPDTCYDFEIYMEKSNESSLEINLSSEMTSMLIFREDDQTITTSNQQTN
jgi:hypothetical protein